jgi:uncharacterized protein
MKTKGLILPGFGDSGPGHWQSLWGKASPSFVRVQQRDWGNPVCDEWLGVLEKSVADTGGQCVLVAHSLACLLVAHWAMKAGLTVKGALLVAPPDPNGAGFPESAIGFSRFPRKPFPFASIVVASTSDPFGSVGFAQDCAAAWGSRFVSIGPAGHINSESGLGEWAEGMALFRQLAA